ncbi:MAG: ubiquitin-like protein Pup [Mycobacteriaceae bacterium]
MPEQVQKHRSTESQRDEAASTTLEDAQAASAAAREESASSLSDDILADIDEALQGLDQDLAAQYMQRGGQ